MFRNKSLVGVMQDIKRESSLVHEEYRRWWTYRLLENPNLDECIEAFIARTIVYYKDIGKCVFYYFSFEKDFDEIYKLLSTSKRMIEYSISMMEDIKAIYDSFSLKSAVKRISSFIMFLNKFLDLFDSYFPRGITKRDFRSVGTRNKFVRIRYCLVRIRRKIQRLFRRIGRLYPEPVNQK